MAETPRRNERSPAHRDDTMWPLNVSIVVLSGVVLYLVFSKLQFDDPRLIYSGRFYAVAVPAAALTIAALLRGFASQYVQKSAQLGFLLSVTVHLLLLLIAFQWVIFRHYRPEASSGVRPDRAPIRRTVPEYLFEKPRDPERRPDWTRPVEADVETRAVVDPARQIDPVQDAQSAQAAPEFDLPTPPDPVSPSPIKRASATSSLPELSDARRRPEERTPSSAQSTPPSLESPDAPPVAMTPPRLPEAEPMERPAAIQRRTNASRTATGSAAAPPPSVLREDGSPAAGSLISGSSVTGPSLAGAISRTVVGTEQESLPSVRQSAPRPPSSPSSYPQAAQPVGSAPEAPTVAAARLQPEADRYLSPQDLPLVRRSRVRDAAPGVALPADRSIEPPLEFGEVPVHRFSRVPLDVLAEMQRPEVVASPGDLPPSSMPRAVSPSDFSPLGVPGAADRASASMPNEASSSSIAAEIDRELMELRRRAVAGGAGSMLPPAEAGELAGLDRPEIEPSLQPRAESPIDRDQPRVAAADLERFRRTKRRLDRRPLLEDDEIVPAKPFQQRVMRTQVGAAPTSTGSAGPATEEAIERGLAYLAQRQKEDGSWSLEGHGERVLLRSDTAATGLCLLAFQGAGYTHRQHQYAATVARGLQFLVDRQRTNGDLFVPADAISNQNVALYSHGIAALAMCEAYGMTQDPELREPAQMSIDYIQATQHRRLGGWRYTPQISADTSVSGWMMMALKSGDLAGLDVDSEVYAGIDRWLELAKAGSGRGDRYRYNPLAPDTPTQRHGRDPTPTMTAVGMLMRMYGGWTPEHPALRSAADYLLEYLPRNGTAASPQRDTYYWYYATQVMFQMGGNDWKAWNRALTPALLETQVNEGENAGSWDPAFPVPDRWSPHAGRLYVTTMNLLNLEVTYRHLPIYGEGWEGG